MSRLQPWMPRRVHAAQIVWISGQLYELRHFVAFVVIKVREQVEALHDLIDAFVDHLNDILDVDLAETLVLTQILIGIDWLVVANALSVNCDNFVTKNRPHNRRELS